MSFHLGNPILVMLIMALGCGAFVMRQPPQPKEQLIFWTFADAHAQTYRTIIDQFEKENNVKVDIQNVSLRAETIRLESMFMSDQSGRILPDLIEIEVGNVGRFFRPPVDEIGFLPLNDYLARDSWDKRIVNARFATWSKSGVIFGVPHDVHPVALV